MSSDLQKKAAATAALDYLSNIDTLGIGTGSTVDYFIQALAKQPHRVETVISSSARTTALLKKHKIAVEDPNMVAGIDLYIDGADEYTNHRTLIKGGGGALTGEKILASMAKKFLCIVDDSKLVPVLGTFPLPIEVIAMARSAVARELVEMGGTPVYRSGFKSDHGHVILDTHNLDLTNPCQVEQQINNIPGVITCGLFALRPADTLIIASKSGITTL